MFKVKDKLDIEHDCYQFVISGDGKVYGVCYHKEDDNFKLLPYNEIKPINDRTLNEENINQAMQIRSKFLG